jgi:putative inorganic carbon (hco3(-)) transporter
MPEMEATDMGLATNSSLRPGISHIAVLELAIALTAVLLAVMAVSYQGFLLLAVCVPLAILALLRFDSFLCGIVFLLPWYPFIDWNLPVRDVFLLAHFVLFAGMCVVQHSKGISWSDWLWRGWLRKGIAAFAVIAIVSLLISDSRDADGALRGLAKLLSYTGLFFSISGWAVTRERIARIIHILLVSTVVVCLFGLYQAWVGDFTSLYFRLYPDMEQVFLAQGGWNGRITSFLFHYNSLAGYLNVVIPLALAASVVERTIGMRRLAFTCLSLCLATLFLTGSRGGWIACCTVLVFAFYYLRPRGRLVTRILAAGVVAFLVLLPIRVETPETSQSARVEGVDDFTVQSRLALWDAAGAMFLEHPVMGAGFGTYRFALQRYVPGMTDQLDAHNLYLQTLAETGIVGFSVFFAALWVSFRGSTKVIKHPDPLFQVVALGIIGGIVATLVHGMVDYIFIVSPQFGNLLWLILGLGLAAGERNNQDPSERLADCRSVNA